MINYLKQNHLSLLIVLFLVLQSSFAGTGNSFGAVTARTTITNPWTFTLSVLNKGGVMNIGSTTAISKLKVGVGTNAGTSFNKLNGQLCYLYPYAASITGQSVATVDCQATSNASGGGGAGALAALTGIAANDFVVGGISSTTANNLATTSATLVVNSPLWIVSVTASSTTGYVTFKLYNASTSPYVWPTSGTASGTAYVFGGN